MTRRQFIFKSTMMAFLMSVIISFAMTVINTGFGPALIFRYLRALPVAFILALVLTFILPPLIQKIIQKLKI
jgi:hypothetical protein